MGGGIKAWPVVKPNVRVRQESSGWTGTRNLARSRVRPDGEQLQVWGRV